MSEIDNYIMTDFLVEEMKFAKKVGDFSNYLANIVFFAANNPTGSDKLDILLKFYALADTLESKKDIKPEELKMCAKMFEDIVR